ncbi:flagellar hook-associated protein FlgK [Marinivivus vitaminiproducens]|uniref:flagellar hook-associated protein FlgK n=1 Tax=Marinivivus vitaminiproducens TaxID=3035935 RepID=UPI0027A9B13F|nr:flagellar hook-associated protein FlgK [Geminicoccaceae bacterium SCSIO 64248]
MSLSTAFSIASTGLRATARQADIAAGNIANAQVEGYVRKEAGLATRVTAGVGGGVDIAAIRRPVDAALARDARRETGAEAALDVRADALKTYATELGQPADERSPASAMARLETAFVALSSTPELASAQRDVLDAASGLVSSLGRASAAALRRRQEADDAIASDVALINRSLEELSGVNDQIKLGTHGGRDVTALEDRRDQLIDTIGERIPLAVIRREPNDVLLVTEQGIPVFDGRPAEVAFRPTPAMPAAASYAPDAVEPGRVGVLSGLTIDGRDVAPGSGDPQAIGGGRLAGLFAVRDRDMPLVQDQLDHLAAAVIDRFQDPATDPSLTGGAPGLFTDGGAAGDTANPAALPGLALRIAVNATVDPAQGGALWRIRDGIGAATPANAGADAQTLRFLQAFEAPLTLPDGLGLATPTTLRGLGDAVVTAQQTRRADVQARADAQAGIARTLRDARDSVAGVDVDAELQKLLQIEQAYAANAMVVQTANRMLDTLMEMT